MACVMFRRQIRVRAHVALHASRRGYALSEVGSGVYKLWAVLRERDG